MFCVICLREITGKPISHKVDGVDRDLHFKCYLRIKKHFLAMMKEIRRRKIMDIADRAEYVR